MHAHGIGSTRQAISQHLEVLEEAGLVVTRREGRDKFHDLDTTPAARDRSSDGPSTDTGGADR